MATVTPITVSPYSTGHLPAGQTLEFQITLDAPDDPVVFLYFINNRDTDRFYVALPPSGILTYEARNQDHTIAIITGRRGINSEVFEFRISTPPPPVNISVPDHFIKNGETIRVYFKMIRKRFLTISDISVDAGTLTNFVANDTTYEYAIDLTAPDEGVGILRLSVTPFANAYEDFLYAPEATEDIVVASRLKPTHLADPENETLYIREVMADDLDDINDFEVLVSFSRNVTFSKEHVMLNAVDSNNDPQPVSLQGFSGENSVYSLIVRPPMIGGEGRLVISIPENVVNEGNLPKVLTLDYSDEIIVPEWSKVFETTDAYKDIVSVDRHCVQMLRDAQIDCFALDGSLLTDLQVNLPDSPMLCRAVKYDVGKYIGFSDAADTTAHLIVDGNEEWASAGVFKRDTYNAADWAWTRDRRLLIVATPSSAPDIGVLPTREVHDAIRRGYDLNDAVFQSLSLSEADVPRIENWTGSVTIGHGDGNLFVASNERNAQNYLSVYDAENAELPAQRIPISGGVTSLFVFEGWLYRYDATEQTLTRFSLDILRPPQPNAEIYPFILLPGDEIPLEKLIKHARAFVFDIGFDKPDWLTIEDRKLKVADDALPKSTAYVRIRGINRNGASDIGACGFYAYVREPETPQWRDFDSLSMYEDQALNMFAFVENADEIQWQHGVTPPPNVEMVNGKIKLK